MNKVQAEGQRANMQMITAIMAKPPDDSSGRMIESWMKLNSSSSTKFDGMVEKLMNVLLSKDKQQVLTPEVIFALQDKMEARIERMMNMGQTVTANNEEGGEDYDPALGFLGNAGKALFGSLKALMDSAATNPKLLELAATLIGSRNPTNQDLARVAYQMEQAGTGLPPALMQHQQHALPQFAPTNQQTIPYPQPPMQPQRSMPPSIAPAQPAPQVQQSVANELEGSASGLPGNGDPEQQRPMTAEELAEENLVDAVTRTLEIMIGESVGKPMQRTWPEDARDHWNKDFIAKLVECTDNRTRLNMIGQKCDPQVAGKLNAIWQQFPEEQNVFWREFMRLMEMVKPQPQQVAPPVVVVTPPAPPVIQPPVQG